MFVFILFLTKCRLLKSHCIILLLPPPQISECRAEYAADIWGHCYNNHILFGIQVRMCVSLKFTSLYILQCRKQCLSCSWHLTKSSTTNVILNNLLYFSPTGILKKSWTHFLYTLFHKCYCHGYTQWVSESLPVVSYFCGCAARSPYKGHDTMIVSGNQDIPCINIHSLSNHFLS